MWQGATSLGLPLRSFLRLLKEAGLGSLPGTAAEVLDDQIRGVLCPDKLTAAQWVEVRRCGWVPGSFIPRLASFVVQDTSFINS